MKDSLNKVPNKIINASQGQASDSYCCYTNRIDYEKWNNHPRYERTHLFFQECFIYFADQVDLLIWDGEKIVNATDILTSWYGQPGC
jgi:hypothetical protein